MTPSPPVDPAGQLRYGITVDIRQTLRRAVRAVRRAASGRQMWREIYVSPQFRPDPVIRRYHHLREHGIRCYLRNLSSPNPRFGYTGQVSLRVYRDDAGRAYQLLRELPD
jgi:hypothetical protein